jgi:hypothetical protein
LIKPQESFTGALPETLLRASLESLLRLSNGSLKAHLMLY